MEIKYKTTSNFTVLPNEHEPTGGYIDNSDNSTQTEKIESVSYEDSIENATYKIPFIDRFQWTPFSEKMPEEEGFYLTTYFSSGCPHGIISLMYWNGKGNWGKNFKKDPITVVAWMKLPEPYERPDKNNG